MKANKKTYWMYQVLCNMLEEVLERKVAKDLIRQETAVDNTVVKLAKKTTMKITKKQPL